MRLKPILIGMNNPVSTRPGHELYPAPMGCTGHRLWEMLYARTGASMRDYLDVFERRNLVRGLEWDMLGARARAFEVATELMGSGRTVVLLGQEVYKAVAYSVALPKILVHPQVSWGVTWRQIPHPSGRNTFYINPDNRKVVELLMEELYNEYAGRV